MGKFDKKIEGEPKVRGLKRKFESNVGKEGYGGERESNLEVLKSVGKKERSAEGGVNVRKAVRYHEREERASGGGRGRGMRARGGRGCGSGRGRGK